jgi:PAS domain S-box-containing protein
MSPALVARRPPRRLWIWGLALALAITLATVAAIRNFERLRNEAAFQAAAYERIDRVDGAIDSAMAGLVSLGAYFDASPELGRDEFFRLTQTLEPAGSPIQALEWIPRVPLAQKDRIVAEGRAAFNAQFDLREKDAEGAMVPVAPRTEYFPVFYLAPVAGNEKAIGFDLASNPARRAALEQAYASGRMTATSRITLVQERGNQYGFLAFRPVFRSGPQPTDPVRRREALAGFVLGVFRIGDIVAGTERAAANLGVSLTLVDQDAKPGEQRLYPRLDGPEPPEPALEPGLAQRHSFDVAGRTWRVTARPVGGAFVPDHAVSTLVAMIGCVLSALLALLLRRLALRQADSEAAAERHMLDLHQERNFNDAILEAAGALIMVIDRKAQIVRFNRAAEDFTGCSFEQVRDQPYFWKRFHVRGQAGEPAGAFDQFREGRRPRRFQRLWQGASGEQRLFDWTVSTIGDAQADSQFLIALGLDITAQKRLEEAARSQEARLRTILENLAEGVCTIDARGEITYLNAQAQSLLGWRLEDLAGRGLRALIRDPRAAQPAPLAHSPIVQAMKARTIYRSSDDVFYDREGKALPVKVSASPLLLGERIEGMVLTFSDVRAERLLQERLVEAKEAAEAAARLKADFLSTMSHEIRTPLNGVIGMTDILLETELAAEQVEFVRIIKTSADALKATIDDILDFSKIEAGRLDLERIEFSPQQLLESGVDIVALRAQEQGLTLASFVDPALPGRFLGDPLRIRQVLLNFLSNAIKFSEQGQILVSARYEEPGDDGPRPVRLAVRDHGIGLTAEAKARLFQPFSQADSSTSRKYGGTGLGLAICKRLVEAMGGRIGVDSEPGEGATFWISLPLDPAPGATAPAPAGAGLHRVLIAGDNAADRAQWCRYVESWRMDVECLDGSVPLLERLRALQEQGRAADAVLLAEPIAEGALAELVPAVRALGPAVVCCIADRLPAARKEALAALGAVAIQLPMKPSALLDALLQAWSRAEAARAPRAEAQPPRRTALPLARGQRLLLAEDNPVNQRVASVVLGRLGYELDLAHNGADAVRMAASGDYAAVLMDCQMPQMDGFQATRAIRAAEAGGQRRVPIIAMTANALDGDRDRCLSAGMDDYLPKPIDALALRDLLARWTAPSAPAGDAAAAAAPAVALGRLQEIFGDDRETIIELFRVFRGSVAQSSAALHRALGAPDGARPLARIRDLAHEIKGMAANMGAESLARSAARLEEMAEQADWSQVEQLGRCIHSEVPRVVAFIDAYVAA